MSDSPAARRGAGPRLARRAIPGDRAWRVGARTVHVAAMGIVLGGVAFDVPGGRLLVPSLLTAASGAVLLGIELWKGLDFAWQGAGAAVWLKLALLGLGAIFPSARLEWYLAATAAASVGSHMPGSWRHYSFPDRRVLERPD